MIRALASRYDVEIIASTRGSYVERFGTIVPRLVEATRRADAVVCGFLGQPLAPIARLLRKPVLLDAFISVYDTLCLDRRVASPRGAIGRLAYGMDGLAVRAAHHVLVDTISQRDFFAATFAQPVERFQTHYLGPDLDLASEPAAPRGEPSIDVLHYGSYLPLHGVEVIVQAAAILRDDPGIRFTLVGTGPRFGEVRAAANRLALDNVHFVGWLPLDVLAQRIGSASIGLGGHFAENPKARRVIAGKTYQFLAQGVPTIVGECAANREIFQHGEDVLMVPMGDARALALAIRDLAASASARARIGHAGSALMRQSFAPERVADALHRAVEIARDRAR